MPFSVDYRRSGILLHITSLPSPYGIGDLGPVATSWIDRLSGSGQSWWQSLPLGPTGYGNSPYQPLSSFAGNALVVSPDWLIEDELLEQPDDTPHPLLSAACFDGHADNPHLPANFVANTVVYTGTHDNPTTRSRFEELNDVQRQRVWNHVKGGGSRSGDAAHALIELAWSSNAALAMTPMQDLLNLGKEARMNVPGRAEGNWRWRCTVDMLSDSAFEWLSELTKTTSRSGTPVAYGVKRLEVASTN